MKKATILTIGALMVLPLAACGKKEAKAPEATETETTMTAASCTVADSATTTWGDEMETHMMGPVTVYVSGENISVDCTDTACVVDGEGSLGLLGEGETAADITALDFSGKVRVAIEGEDVTCEGVN